MHFVPLHPQAQLYHNQSMEYSALTMTQYSQAPSPQSACSDYNSPSPLGVDFTNESDLLVMQQPTFNIIPLPAYNGPVRSSGKLAQSLPAKVRTTKAPSPGKRTTIAHPYARLFAKKDEVKRRKIWNHALEKSIFDPREL